MTLRALLALALCGLLSAGLVAQDDANKGDAAKDNPPAKAEEKSAENKGDAAKGKAEKPAEEKAETKPQDKKPEPKAEEKPEPKDFAAVFEQWKALLGEMTTLRREYFQADAERQTEIRKEYDQLIAKGEKLEPQLSQAAQEAYSTAPKDHPDAADFLASLARQDYQQDQYEQSYQVADNLLSHGYDNAALLEIGGMSALETMHFDQAKQWLSKAVELQAIDTSELSGALGGAVTSPEQVEQLIDQRAERWQKEKAIREKEAQADDLPRVKLTTTAGEIVVELFENEAPNTVANFITLVEKDYYDGTPFHRVLPAFMAQGGDPTGSGSGGPGYSIPDELGDDARDHWRGSMSMAHAGADTGGSQFFLTFRATSHLDGRHTVFGRVIDGIEVAADFQRIDPSSPGSKPEPDRILKAEVLRKRDHEYKVRKIGDKPEEPAKPAEEKKPDDKPAEMTKGEDSAEDKSDEAKKPEEKKPEEKKPAEEPKAEEKPGPMSEEPKAEEPKAEEPKAEEPKAEEPKAEASEESTPPESGSGESSGESTEGDSEES